MSFTLSTALREIVEHDHELQPYELTHLCRERYRQEKGVWVRKTYFDDLQTDNVFLLPDGMKLKGREVSNASLTSL